MTNQPASAAGRLLCLSLLCLLLATHPAAAQDQVQTPVTTDVNYAIGGYYECLPVDYGKNTKKYPLLIFIHGIGELGDGSPAQLPRVLKFGLAKVINRKLFPNSFTVNGQTSSFIVISPQFRKNYRDAAVVSSLIDYCVAKYRVDESRIYLTGLSMGGGISWIYAAKSEANAKRLAALLAICGNTNASSGGVANMANANLPVWATHNDGDGVVPASNSINWYNGLSAYVPAMSPQPLLNIFNSTSHDAWSKTYDPNFKPNGLNVYEWMLSHKRGATPVPNKAPVANAGGDQTITLPLNTITVTGSGTDGDGRIAGYAWTKVSGPAGGAITTPSAATTPITGLAEGSYVFRLTVTDDDGATHSDDLKITVNGAPNKAPVASAGPDQTIQLPANSVNVAGSALDADGTIAAYAWTKISGPLSGSIATPNAAATSITALVEGTYVFRLTATDNDGATHGDDIKITVNAAANKAPVAHAGGDQTITLPTNEVSVSGSGIDEDGTLASYKWAKRSGPASGTIANPTSASTTVTGLIEGTYVFELTVTDNKGATDFDEMQVTVQRAPNKAPAANAGADQTITLPVNNSILIGVGTDSDGSIASYKWTKVSGPAEGSIASPDKGVTVINDLAPGTYLFRLTVKDNDGAAGTDEVTVTVNEAPNEAPTANAGADQTIMLPQDSVSVWGVGADEDGVIDNYTWTKISGPAGGIIRDNAAAQTIIAGLAEGSYTFRLTVSDNDSATAWDELKITVKPEKLAIANAGKDTLIFKNQTRPDTAVLNGSASVGGAQYVWRKTSGPGATAIEDSTATTTYAIGLQEGTHIFKLLIDGKATDEMQVVVRDWQKKNIKPCRPGRGKAFIVPETSSGLYYHPYINRDNAVGEPVMGGDTLYFKGGVKKGFEIGDFGGGKGCPVYVLPKDEALVITDGFFRIGNRDSNVVQHVVLDGTVLRNKGVPYGFFMDNRSVPENGINHDGLSARWVSHFTVKGYRSINTGIMQIKLDAQEAPYGRYDKFIQKRIKIQDNFLDGSKAEGMYIGHTGSNGGQANNPYGPPPRMDSVEISDNIVLNAGWDGIQLANARTAALIRHNLVYKAGTENMATQRAGILMGANTTGVVDSNIVINATGNGIQVFGYGAVKVQSNIVDSIKSGGGDQDGLYQSHYTVVPETFNIPLSVVNSGNLVSRVERMHIKVANNGGNMIAGRTVNNFLIDPVEKNANNLIDANAGDAVNNNEVIADFPFHINEVTTKGQALHISMTQGDATETFTSVKETVDWLFGRLRSVTASNEAPVANAGTDKTITLPLDSVTVTGSGADNDGSITAYQWKQLSGPAGAVLHTPKAARTAIAKLVQGVYKFELAVTDNGTKTGRDTVKVTVMAAPEPENSLPKVYAGADLRITLPVNSVTLKGTATDEDGTITATKWTKISGLQNYTLADEAALETTAGILVEGVYRFELRATDNKGAVAKDTVKVTVLAQEVVPQNILPVAKAGADQTIQLPVATVTLIGSGTDADGTVEGYRWEKASGPAQGIITNANAAVTTVSGLGKGIYTFVLTVTDDLGATASDTVQITVLPKANSRPVADAGGDQTIQLPLNSVILNGNGTDDDGSIEGYNWTKLSGPSLPSFTGAATAQTQVKNLTAGVYVFELKVTDDEGAWATDTVKITVKAAAVVPNKAPVAQAGNDITVQLPQATSILSGSGMDEDGTIKAYQWKQLSGPAMAVLATPKDAQTAVSGLVQGVYQFEITVTDDDGATATDAVFITVKAAAPVPNKAPVVMAGRDYTLTLPQSEITVTGAATDSDGSIASHRWTKVSGPAQYAIATPHAAKTRIGNLVKGVYLFELKATDNRGATASDTLMITVEAAATRPMLMIDAGEDKTILLPTDSVVLKAVVDDPDGSVRRYTWRKVGGPAGGKIANARASETLATGLVEGVYLFACTATDAHGNMLSDTVQITVQTLIKSTATVFPNPTNGAVQIRIEANTRATNTVVTLYDMGGRPVHRESFMRTGGSITKAMNIAHLPKGVYTVEIIVDINNKISTKLVKQ